MSFQVRIIGSGSAMPSKGRHHSAQVIKADHIHYLVDCGEGTQFNLASLGINLHKIDVIFISHLHGDHYLGVVGLISTLGMMGRKKPLKLYCPFGLSEIITTHFRISGTVLEYPLDVREFESNSKQIIHEDEKLKVYSFPLPHGVPTQGYLFEEQSRPLSIIKEKLPTDILVQEIGQLKAGKDVLDDNGTIKYAVQEFTRPREKSSSYAYCSDTEFSAEVIDFIRGVDVLYHETTYLEDHREKAIRNKHCTAKEAATIAREAGVGKLLIGHLSSRYDDFEAHLIEAKKEFAQVEAAVEGATFTIGN